MALNAVVSFKHEMFITPRRWIKRETSSCMRDFSQWALSRPK